MIPGSFRPFPTFVCILQNTDLKLQSGDSVAFDAIDYWTDGLNCSFISNYIVSIKLNVRKSDSLETCILVGSIAYNGSDCHSAKSLILCSCEERQSHERHEGK